jgi:hypothetical protein
MSRQEKDLDRQLASLLQNAPKDGDTARAVGIISPVLKAIASQLKHSSYFILQSEDGSWLLTTLSNRDSPEIEKNVVYVYSTQTAANGERLKIGSPGIVCTEIGAIEILFQLLGLKSVDSLIFFDQAHDTQTGIEIGNTELQALCAKQVNRVKSSHRKLANAQIA